MDSKVRLGVYWESDWTPMGLDWDWTVQIAGVGWGTSPIRLQSDSNQTPIIPSDSDGSPIGSMGECKDLSKVMSCDLNESAKGIEVEEGSEYGGRLGIDGVEILGVKTWDLVGLSSTLNMLSKEQHQGK